MEPGSGAKAENMLKFVGPFDEDHPNVKKRNGISTNLKGEFDGRVKVVEVSQKTLKGFHRSCPEEENVVHIPQLVDLDMFPIFTIRTIIYLYTNVLKSQNSETSFH